MRTFLLTGALIFGCILNADAAFIATFSEVGNDVVVVGSGSINLDSLSSSPRFIDPSNLIPRYANLALGSGPRDVYSNAIFGPTSFGFGGAENNATSSVGDFVSIGGFTNILAVPQGYSSGSPLSDRAVFTGTTFSSLGLAPGIYDYVIRGSGDTVRVQIGTIAPPPVAVPEPGTIAVLGIGVLGLAAVLRRRDWSSTFCRPLIDMR